MANVDFLSRNPALTDIPDLILLAEKPNHWLLAEQQRDSDISSIILKIQNIDLGESLAKTYESRSKMLSEKFKEMLKLCVFQLP